MYLLLYHYIRSGCGYCCCRCLVFFYDCHAKDTQTGSPWTWPRIKSIRAHTHIRNHMSVRAYQHTNIERLEMHATVNECDFCFFLFTFIICVFFSLLHTHFFSRCFLHFRLRIFCFFFLPKIFVEPLPQCFVRVYLNGWCVWLIFKLILFLCYFQVSC